MNMRVRVRIPDLIRIFVAMCFPVVHDAWPSTRMSPDLVVIVADDLGWADTGYHGSPIPTPALDRMATEGIRLERFYVAAMCTPTRAAFLTGRYWSRFGNTNPSNERVLPEGTATLASILRDAGYRTAITGKWHLGSTPGSGPEHYGFDHSYGALAGGVAPWLHTYKKGRYARTWHRNHQFVEESGHVTDLITREALDFLEQSQSADQPRFLYVPYTAVHHPLQEPDQWMAKARAIAPERAQYTAAVMHMDDGIGRILEAVSASGRDRGRETLVVFFSDNGGTIGPQDGDNSRYAGTYALGEPLGLNAPLRGRKTQPFEGGIRVPAIIYSPSWLEPRVIGSPVHVIDLLPTLLSMLNVGLPDRDLKLDGSSRHDLLIGLQEDDPYSHQPYYWLGVSRRSETVLQFPWKWIGFNEPEKQEYLFNIEVDPYESRNLIDINPELVAGLKEIRDASRQLNDTVRP